MTRRSHAGTDPAASRPWEEEVPALLQPIRHRDAGLFSWPSVSRALVMLLTLTVALQIMLLLRSHPTPEPQHKPCSARGDGFSGHAAAHSHAASTPPQPDADVDDFQQGSVDSLYPEPKPWAKRMAGHPSAAWAVAGETEKSGAGLLFFAYGGKQLGHFLDEAQTAARSFRRLNPKIRIALVSNTRRPLDNRTWDVQIRPRPDLLFAGGLNNGDWGDSLPRQWLTRLYYLAHSPFKITWALDSNVYACTPGSAQAFLDDALRRELWGYDIATANQRDGPMYPHNFNLVYRWSDRTSALLRDWFLLQVCISHNLPSSPALSTFSHLRLSFSTAPVCRSDAASTPTTRRPSYSPSCAR